LCKVIISSAAPPPPESGVDGEPTGASAAPVPDAYTLKTLHQLAGETQQRDREDADGGLRWTDATAAPSAGADRRDVSIVGQLVGLGCAPLRLFLRLDPPDPLYQRRHRSGFSSMGASLPSIPRREILFAGRRGGTEEKTFRCAAENRGQQIARAPQSGTRFFSIYGPVV
jgi:hypothetical protein